MAAATRASAPRPSRSGARRSRISDERIFKCRFRLHSLLGSGILPALRIIASMHSSIRRAWVEVDLGALLRNGAAIAARAGVPCCRWSRPTRTGSARVRVARALEQLDPWGFGVATIAEGEELRRAGITRPIVVFTPLLLGDFDAAIRADLTPTLGDRGGDRARGQTTGRAWHLAIDTGMSRAGIRGTRSMRFAIVLAAVAPQGVFTHFHSAERDDADARRCRRSASTQRSPRCPIRPAMIHAENSPAVEHRGPSQWTLARPGDLPLRRRAAATRRRSSPEPVVSRARAHRRAAHDSRRRHRELRRHLARRRATGGSQRSRIGYADGYRRALSNRGVGARERACARRSSGA